MYIKVFGTQQLTDGARAIDTLSCKACGFEPLLIEYFGFRMVRVMSIRVVQFRPSLQDKTLCSATRGMPFGVFTLNHSMMLNLCGSV